MNTVSTHVLDTARGEPVEGMAVTFEHQKTGGWQLLGNVETNSDGRIPRFDAVGTGIYRLRFDIGAHQAGFYPEVSIVFRIDDPARHYHVPLLLSPYGYSTYRGS